MVALLAGTAVGCGPSVQDRLKAESTAAAAAAAKSVALAGEVFLARREAQVYFDSARASFVAKKNVAAARSLRDAALFNRQHADSAAAPAKNALKQSSQELDRLATRVARGGVTSVRTLDRAFARAQLADAQNHCLRALDAWKKLNAPVTGAELMMLADHFERGATDAKQQLSEPARKAIANGRALAAKLVQGEAVSATAVDSTLGALDKELHALIEVVAPLKG